MERSNSWRKSTYSTAGGNDGCVEAAHAPGRVLVRDTTDRAGYTMPVASRQWRAFIDRVKDGIGARR